MEHINICMFGLNRSLSKTYQSIYANIFQPLKEYNIQSSLYANFISTKSFSNARSKEIDRHPEKQPEFFLKFDKLTYSDQAAIDDSIDWIRAFQFGDNYNQIDKSNISSADSTTKNIFRSLFCLQASYDLIEKNNLTSPTLFIRPDTEVQSKLDLDLLLPLLKIKPKKYAFGLTDGIALTPNWHCWSGVNDRLAICTPGNASEIYARRFNKLVNYVDASRKPIHSETYLLHVLQQSRIQVLPVINTLLARIRATGRAYPEDYSEGRKSYDFQAETINILSSTVKEQEKQIKKLKENKSNQTTNSTDEGINFTHKKKFPFFQ